MIYRKVIRPILFRQDPEKVHHFVSRLLERKAVQCMFSLLSGPKVHIPKQILGIDFPNPLGLAAGFDKNGDYLNGLVALGFGFIEVGTVTPKPQPGNAQPRLFRLPADQAIINRMGFNNKGVDHLRRNLEKRPPGVVIGGNIGKNKSTPNERAADDYLYCLRELHEYVDYFTINISSPNTPDLRRLQDKKPLHALLYRLQEANTGLKTPRPLLLKIAPDMTMAYLDDVMESVTANRFSGIIVSNTTIKRDGLKTPPPLVNESGGLSGRPLKERATAMVRHIRKNSALTIIGVGGIFTGKDAMEKIQAGADLVQIFTGLIYEGPLMVRRILKEIERRTQN